MVNLCVTARPLMEQLRRCLPAVRRLERHEDDLRTAQIIGGLDNALPFLEKRMLDLANSGTCLGVCLGTFFQHKDFTIARLVQHGCFQGSFSTRSVHYLCVCFSTGKKCLLCAYHLLCYCVWSTILTCGLVSHQSIISVTQLRQ